jgi:uncharacterized membrane protein YfcA
MSIEIIYLSYAVIGAIAGVLSGLLGIGGGIITVPCLLLLFPYLGFPKEYIMHMAIATSLAAMIFNTTSATLAHNRRGTILWGVFRKLFPGLVIGSVIGALIAISLSDSLLEVVFGTFLLILALYFFLSKAVTSETHQLPHTLILNFFSGGIGAISNVLGIGGGSMMVPLLTAFKIKDKNAIGISAVSTLITTLCGTISYLIFGWGDVQASDTFGLINLPACLIIGIAAFITAPYGAKLTHEINASKVRKIFAIVLALTGLSLIF